MQSLTDNLAKLVRPAVAPAFLVCKIIATFFSYYVCELNLCSLFCFKGYVNTTMSPNSPCIHHCVNGVQDYDEVSVDCGGADCGGCSITAGATGLTFDMTKISKYNLSLF